MRDKITRSVSTRINCQKQNKKTASQRIAIIDPITEWFEIKQYNDKSQSQWRTSSSSLPSYPWSQKRLHWARITRKCENDCCRSVGHLHKKSTSKCSRGTCSLNNRKYHSELQLQENPYINLSIKMIRGATSSQRRHSLFVLYFILLSEPCLASWFRKRYVFERALHI